MRYKNATAQSFAEYVISRDGGIILFGAGAVCKTYVPYIAGRYGLTSHIRCVVDNDPAKQGRTIELNGRSVPVAGPEALRVCGENDCVLITNGDFYPVMTQLDRIGECRDTDCFIAAYIQLGGACDRTENHVFRDYETARIPRIIHYCWFSGRPIPKELQRCMETWKEKCPGYEIIRWDENSCDLGRYRYTKEAWELGKWGYIPDIVRLEKLYEIGGFYLDTDVELVRSLDPLRCQEAFCGRERAGHVNFGGGSGCVKGSAAVKELLDFRKDEPFLLGDGRFNAEASGYYETSPLMKKGLRIEDTNQKLEGINVYASEFFSPYNYINGEDIRNENTFSIHHFSGSWLEKGDSLRRETREKYRAVKERLEEIRA